MIHQTDKICPRCDSADLKAWWEMSDEQKDIVARRKGERFDEPKQKKHHVCTRCFFEQNEAKADA